MNHFTYNSFTELIYLSYLHCHRIKVLSSHTFSAIGISYLNMLTRSSDWIFNPMRYAGLIYRNVIWENSFNSLIDPLFILRKIIIRIINHIHIIFLVHTNNLFLKCNTQKLIEINSACSHIGLYIESYILQALELL